jgi:hypothetical protein
VAILVAKDSVEHQQFSQLYPVFVFPSAFCIGLTGKPLVIMNGQQSASQIKDKVEEAFEKLRGEVQSLSTTQSQATPTHPETPPTQIQDNPTVQPNVSSSPQPSIPPPEKIEPSPPTTSEIPSPPTTNEIPSPPTTSAPSGGAEGEGGGNGPQHKNREEKLERAQQTIKKRRQEREEAEFRKQKSAELQRREEGKQMAESRKDLEDLHKQTWIQERKKAKEEEKRAREEVLAKLRQDQMEREAQKKAREQAASELRQRSSQSTPQSSPSNSISSSNGVCRLQLRMPSGGKSVVEMKAESRLGTLRERIAEELCVSAESLVLSSTYPRRELTVDMEDTTLVQLGLAPSGVVIVRLNRGSSTGSGKEGSPSSLWGIILSLFQLLMSVVTLVKRLCGWGGGEETAQQNATNTRSYPAGSSSGGGGTRRERVRRFHPADFEDDTSDDDDERRNTYNGNSTEQQ